MLQVRDGALQVLLWQRARAPFARRWALPGGRLDPTDTLERSIRRHLAAKVDVREVSHLEQLETRADPKSRRVTTAYLGLVRSGLDPAVPEDTRWHPVATLPPTAFDHGAIALAGRERLRAKLSYTNLGFALAPETFTHLGAPRPVHGRARTRRLGHEPSASAPPPRRAGADRRAAALGPGRREAGRGLPVPLGRPRDH